MFQTDTDRASFCQDDQDSHININNSHINVIYHIYNYVLCWNYVWSTGVESLSMKPYLASEVSDNKTCRIMWTFRFRCKCAEPHECQEQIVWNNSIVLFLFASNFLYTHKQYKPILPVDSINAWGFVLAPVASAVISVDFTPASMEPGQTGAWKAADVVVAAPTMKTRLGLTLINLYLAAGTCSTNNTVIHRAQYQERLLTQNTQADISGCYILTYICMPLM